MFGGINVTVWVTCLSPFFTVTSAFRLRLQLRDGYVLRIYPRKRRVYRAHYRLLFSVFPFLSSPLESNATNGAESFTMSADPLDVVGQGHTWYGYNLVSLPGPLGLSPSTAILADETETSA